MRRTGEVLNRKLIHDDDDEDKYLLQVLTATEMK